jgi:hypothetical protein
MGQDRGSWILQDSGLNIEEGARIMGIVGYEEKSEKIYLSIYLSILI